MAKISKPASDPRNAAVKELASRIFVQQCHLLATGQLDAKWMAQQAIDSADSFIQMADNWPPELPADPPAESAANPPAGSTTLADSATATKTAVPPATPNAAIGMSTRNTIDSL